MAEAVAVTGLRGFSERLMSPEVHVVSGISALEDAVPVEFEEFVFSDKYLNYGDVLYPQLFFILDNFYSPQKYRDYWIDCGISPEDVDTMAFRELVILAGYKTGKTTAIAVLALYELYKLLCLESPQEFYRQSPEQVIFITNYAVSGEQAKDTIWSHIRGIKGDVSPWFQRYDEILGEMKDKEGPLLNVLSNMIEYRHKKITARYMHSNSGSLVGRTNKLAAIDEIAKMDLSGGTRVGRRMYNAAKSTTAPLGEDGLVVSISNPAHNEDAICELLGQCEYVIEGEYAKKYYEPTKTVGTQIKSKNMLGAHFATWEVNRSRTWETFETERVRNPELVDLDYGGIPALPKGAYFKNPDKVRNLFEMSERPSPFNADGTFSDDFWGEPDVHYWMHFDAGQVGKKLPDGRFEGSCFGVAVGHGEPLDHVIDYWDYNVIPTLDLVHRIEASSDLGEVDYENEVKPFLLDLCERLTRNKSIQRRLHLVSDRWNDIWIRQRLRAYAVVEENHTVKKDDYDLLKSCIYSGEYNAASTGQPFYQPCLYVYYDEDLMDEILHLQEIRGQAVEEGDGHVQDMSDCVASVVSHILNTSQRAPRKAGRTAPAGAGAMSRGWSMNPYPVPGNIPGSSPIPGPGGRRAGPTSPIPPIENQNRRTFPRRR